MNKWLIVHSLESYRQNPRMIGFAAKTKLDGSIELDKQGRPIPYFNRILQLRASDRIVYYCKGDSVIKGIYEIVQSQYSKESQWPDSPFQFEIKPILELEEPLDFRLLIGSLDLFKDLANPLRWGGKLMGSTNSIRPLTDHDFEVIERALIEAHGEEDATTEAEQSVDRKHLLIQKRITEWGLKNNYRVHVAINDKSKVKETLTEILDEIPRFAGEQVMTTAKRVDVLFFDKERDILTHAFEIENTPTMFSGLLRLNDIAESYPSQNVSFLIISDAVNEEKFSRELVRPSFGLLRKYGCRFITYEQVDKEWEQLKHKRPPIF